MSRFESVLKWLDREAKVARRAMESATLLEDKLRFCRVQTELETARHKLRLQYFEFEDVAKWAEAKQEAEQTN